MSNYQLKQYFPYSKGHNPLLLRDEVGRSKRSHYNLPDPNFIYGKPLNRDKEGAKEVSMIWKFHDSTRNKLPNRDFAQLNKMSLKVGAFKPNHQTHFRKFNDARETVKQGKMHIDFSLPEFEFRYGKKNRPSTPINQVLGNIFGVQAEVQQQEQYEQTNYEQKLSRPQTSLVLRTNKAEFLSRQSKREKIDQMKQSKYDQKEQFKLSRFKSVRPRTDTHVSEKGKSQIGKMSQFNNNENQQQQQSQNLNTQQQQLQADQQQQFQHQDEKYQNTHPKQLSKNNNAQVIQFNQ